VDLDVSIVVLSYDHWDYTHRLIQSLAEKTEDSFREVLIVDNGSRVSTCDALKELVESQLGQRLNIRVSFLGRNIGIASGRNVGGGLAQGKYLLFLDNDVEIVQTLWLRRLVEAFCVENSVGIVGGVLKNPNRERTIQFAGGYVDTHGRVAFSTSLPVAGEGLPFLGEGMCSPVLPSMFCLGACFMTSTDVWKAMGGFDPQYDPMDYEDIDYCLRASERGWQSVIALDAHLLHHEHVTTGTRGFPRVKQYLMSGRKFLARWKDRLPDSRPQNSMKNEHVSNE
jgi:O-antigen biosynthesis protein